LSTHHSRIKDRTPFIEIITPIMAEGHVQDPPSTHETSIPTRPTPQEEEPKSGEAAPVEDAPIENSPDPEGITIADTGMRFSDSLINRCSRSGPVANT
jgi:hypothetical protein